MHRYLSTVLRYLLSLGLAVFLMYYALRQIDYRSVLASFVEANYAWILVSAAMGVLSHLIRSLRWKMLLSPLGYHPSLGQVFTAVMGSYVVNLVIPRGGEVYRCAVLMRSAKVPVTVSLGTLILERLIDVLILGAMIGSLFLVEFSRFWGIIEQVLQPKLQALGLSSSALLLFPLALLSLGLAFWLWLHMRKRLQAWQFYVRVEQWLQEVFKGLQSIRQVPNKALFVLYSLSIWGLYLGMAYVLFFCFEHTSGLSLWVAYVSFVAGAIGMAAPVQGGIGAYHMLVSWAFENTGLSGQEAIVMATFMHTIQTVVVMVAGGCTLLISALFLQNHPQPKPTYADKN
ncbi:lysylphosphatidylglycerol synthase transmembrane domain-containing protein [Eisenibacter elegans]|uniref:lysylphosphatidylglycerol synthase transmembrane domain-containing protein n=1 Tax=Eisenibacter elegans TaxID=997 RepID=UPI00040B1A05|nr:lysylphosphatidylglycerol synthase transmembrane domain-containing protein [Eisenibacter elegans]